MGDFSVDGSELKKMVKLAKKEPVSFAFNPGKSEEDAYCGMHRNKPPAQLGKDAKDSAEGGKFTFGTASVEGKTISLTCLRDLPGLAKRFKKYLKSQKVMLNVVIMDADGNVIDSDIEDDLPDDPELEGEEEGGGQQSEEAEAIPDAPPPPPDTGAIMKRLAALRERITALPPEAQGKVAGPFKQLVDLVKGNDLERAAAGADRLEAAITLLANQTGQAAPAAPPAPPPPQNDPQLQKLMEFAASTRTRIEGRPDDGTRAQLLAAMDKVDGHIKAKEVEAAVTLLKKLGDILKSLPEPGAPGQPGQDGPNKDKTDWETRFGQMEDRINEVLTKGLIEKVDDLRKLRDWTTGMAMQGQHDKALQALPRIEALLDTIPADGPTAFETEIGTEVKPFAEARLRWAGARSTMMSEVQKLVALIQAEAAEDDLLATAAANVGVLTQNVAKMDERLEDKLDDMVKTSAGGERDRRKGEARALIGEYQKELGTPFFQDIDGASGFGSVAVASTARAALADIARVLA